MRKIGIIGQVGFATALAVAMAQTQAPMVRTFRARPLSASMAQIKKRKEELLDEYLEWQRQQAQARQDDLKTRKGLKPFVVGQQVVWAMNRKNAERKFNHSLPF